MRTKLASRHIITFALLAGFLGFAFFAAQPAWASAGIVPDCAKVAGTNPPDLNCVLLTFRNVASLIIGLTGSAALLMFVYGGFTMITSAGASDKIKKGKTILTNAVIGIFLIFTAGYIIDYVVNNLTGGQQLTGKCNGGLGTYSNGVCKTPCQAMAGQGFQCTKNPTGNCVAEYTCGDASMQCCIP